MSVQAVRAEHRPSAFDLLSEILRRPESVREVPLEAIPAMLAQLAATQSMLTACLLDCDKGQSSEHAGGDRLLTSEEAAKRLGVEQCWLYRRAGRLPFTVRLGRV